jgi:hypothetical protein
MATLDDLLDDSSNDGLEAMGCDEEEEKEEASITDFDVQDEDEDDGEVGADDSDAATEDADAEVNTAEDNLEAAPMVELQAKPVFRFKDKDGESEEHSDNEEPDVGGSSTPRNRFANNIHPKTPKQQEQPQAASPPPPSPPAKAPPQQSEAAAGYADNAGDFDDLMNLDDHFNFAGTKPKQKPRKRKLRNEASQDGLGLPPIDVEDPDDDLEGGEEAAVPAVHSKAELATAKVELKADKALRKKTLKICTPVNMDMEGSTAKHSFYGKGPLLGGSWQLYMGANQKNGGPATQLTQGDILPIKDLSGGFAVIGVLRQQLSTELKVLVWAVVKPRRGHRIKT